MAPGEDHQDGGAELRVTDRRRFTVDGDMRDGDDEAPAARTPPPAAAPPSVEPGAAPRAAAEPAPAEEAVFDLGVEAVFYIFYQSAMIALGATTPHGPPRVDLTEARQAISFLEVLEQKTRGNLTPEEVATLRELTDEARLAFVRVAGTPRDERRP